MEQSIKEVKDYTFVLMEKKMPEVISSNEFFAKSLFN
jgi:hypothetical protein